jgi:hypothetical protein
VLVVGNADVEFAVKEVEEGKTELVVELVAGLVVVVKVEDAIVVLDADEEADDVDDGGSDVEDDDGNEDTDDDGAGKVIPEGKAEEEAEEVGRVELTGCKTVDEVVDGINEEFGDEEDCVVVAFADPDIETGEEAEAEAEVVLELVLLILAEVAEFNAEVVELKMLVFAFDEDATEEEPGSVVSAVDDAGAEEDVCRVGSEVDKDVEDSELDATWLVEEEVEIVLDVELEVAPFDISVEVRG